MASGGGVIAAPLGDYNASEGVILMVSVTPTLKVLCSTPFARVLSLNWGAKMLVEV